MTPTEIMTQDADMATLRYGLLLEGWRSLYAAALDQSHFGTPKQIQEITVKAYGLASLYLTAEKDQIESDSSQYALEAQRVTLDEMSSTDTSELSEPAGEHLSELNDYLLSEITTQIERDIAFLRQSLRSTILYVQMAARANGLPLRTALMQYRIGNAAELKFFFHDRRHKAWSTRLFIKAVWRQHLLNVYNETVLITLSEHGVDTAQISHTDPESEHHGAIISIDSNTALPTYGDLKPVVFHPNSQAILMGAV